jgi:hypothetical protein
LIRRLGLIALATFFCVGCPAAHSDYPTRACSTNDDCFLGEHCLNSSVCVPNTDMAVVAKRGDLSRLDLEMP